MAEEGYDGEAFASLDGEEVFRSAGGYVDDDIDLDDDDDDEPLVKGKKTNTLSPSIGQSSKKRARPAGSPDINSSEKKPKHESHPDDFKLRAAGTGELRDYVIARFSNRMPDFSNEPHVRLYRQYEETERGRERALARNKNQLAYYNSFAGKRRLERLKKNGVEFVPDRAKKGWTLEAMPENVAKQVEEQRREKLLKEANEAAQAAAGGSTEQKGSSENEGERDLSASIDKFVGNFDGKTRNAEYAIMVMNQGSKTVDVIPVGNFAWFTFRANRHISDAEYEDIAAAAVKQKKEQLKRVSKYMAKYENAQAKREHEMGDDSRKLHDRENFAVIGLHRGVGGKEEDEFDAENDGMDFEQDFDNDDVAQVDPEQVQKPERRVDDAARNQKMLERMIKDEIEGGDAARPSSPGSDVEDDGGASPEAGQKSGSRSPSPGAEKTGGGSRSPSGKTKNNGAQGSQQATPLGIGMTPFTTASPGRSSRGSTPRRIDVSHLLPRAHESLTEDHVRKVLSVLLEGREKIPIRECINAFQASDKEKKHKLAQHLKRVATVTQEGGVGGKGKKTFITWPIKGAGGGSTK